MEAQFQAATAKIQAVLGANGLQKVEVYSDGANSPIFTFTGMGGRYVEVDTASFSEVYSAVRRFTGVRREADKWSLTIGRQGGVVTGVLNNQKIHTVV